jgi:hypothetical protein
MTSYEPAKPGAYSKKLGEFPLPRGGSVVVRKPRGTRHADMLLAAPTIVDAIRSAILRARLSAYRAHRASEATRLDGVEDSKEAEGVRATLEWCDRVIEALEARVGASTDDVETIAPSAELAAVYAYLVEHITDMRGVDDYDWRAMDDEAREEFIALLGPSVSGLLARIIQAYDDLGRPVIEGASSV